MVPVGLTQVIPHFQDSTTPALLCKAKMSESRLWAGICSQCLSLGGRAGDLWGSWWLCHPRTTLLTPSCQNTGLGGGNSLLGSKKSTRLIPGRLHHGRASGAEKFLGDFVPQLPGQQGTGTRNSPGTPPFSSPAKAAQKQQHRILHVAKGHRVQPGTGALLVPSPEHRVQAFLGHLQGWGLRPGQPGHPVHAEILACSGTAGPTVLLAGLQGHRTLPWGHRSCSSPSTEFSSPARGGGTEGVILCFPQRCLVTRDDIGLL